MGMIYIDLLIYKINLLPIDTYGKVYLGVNLITNKTVAIKIIERTSWK